MIDRHFHIWRPAWVAVIAASVACVFPARTQAMDYGSLEKLFGEPVTTSATGSPQRSTEVPANMIIVTADEIRRSGARDIPSVLRHVTGIDVLQWTAGDTEVSIRGYNQALSSRTLVLIDGRQVYADFYGFVPWSTLPVELSAIRQIEIVKGPSSALFGFNAVGGVINIVTFNPMYDDVNTVSVRAGTQGLVEGSGVATFKLGSVGALRLSGGLSTANEFNTPIPPSMIGASRTDNTREAVDANAVVKLADNIEFGLDASHTQVRRNEMGPIYTFTNSRYETNSIKAQLTADTHAGLLKFTAYGNWITQRALTGEAPPAVFNSQVTVVQADDVFNIGTHHTMRAALEYRHNSVNTGPTTGGNIFYDVMSASGMWKWEITRALSLTNALRFDHLSLGRSGMVPVNYPLANSDWHRTIDELSFNSGLVWKVDDRDTLRLLVGRGVELPNLAETGGLLADYPTGSLTGVPSLEATTVTNYELAWDRALPSYAARVRASLFHQHSDKLISFEGDFLLTPGGAFVTPSNIGNSDADGLELSLDGTISKDWRWSLGYRAEIVKDQFVPSSVGGANFVDYQHTTPKHTVKAALGWTHGVWEADAYLGYQSKTLGLQQLGPLRTALVPIDQYVSVDARVAYRLTDRATIAISGQNLSQARQHQTSGAGVERQVFGTLSVNF